MTNQVEMTPMQVAVEALELVKQAQKLGKTERVTASELENHAVLATSVLSAIWREYVNMVEVVHQAADALADAGRENLADETRAETMQSLSRLTGEIAPDRTRLN